MSQSKAQILTMATHLAIDFEYDDTMTVFFDDEIESLAKSRTIFTENALVDLSDGTATYDFESDMLSLLFAVMEDAAISMDTEKDLEAYSYTWRTDEGTPLSVVQDNLNRQYTLYPTPNFDSGVLAPIHGEPLGEDYPDDQLWIVYAQDRTASIQNYYGLPISLFVLSREFEIASEHQDLDFSGACRQVGELIFKLLGA